MLALDLAPREESLVVQDHRVDVELGSIPARGQELETYADHLWEAQTLIQ